jgi:hypothetical protein
MEWRRRRGRNRTGETEDTEGVVRARREMEETVNCRCGRIKLSPTQKNLRFPPCPPCDVLNPSEIIWGGRR